MKVNRNDRQRCTQSGRGHTRVLGDFLLLRKRVLLVIVALLLAVIVGTTFYVIDVGRRIQSDLQLVQQRVPQLEDAIRNNDVSGMHLASTEIQRHASDAKSASTNPVWTLTTSFPIIGPNFVAVSEVAQTADDVARLAVAPLVDVYETLDWTTLSPSTLSSQLEPLQAAAPTLRTSAYALSASAEKLRNLDKSNLFPVVAEPLRTVEDHLAQVQGALDAAANAASIAPPMLGSNGVRNYLLVIQNNAEARASGGIPGALAVITFDNGRLSLGEQSSAWEVGAMSPSVSVDRQQQEIYTSRLGKYMQDVNLTPDFPTAASTARTMWERKTGQRVDGVISVDPVTLSYILRATGPVRLSGPELAAVSASGLPTELTGDNVVPTLLADVYSKIHDPQLQDAYFAGVAKEIFSALSTGKGDASALLNGVISGTREGRVLVWSADPSEQDVIGRYRLSGSISGPSVSPAQFGVYFNDGTGAKMDYYVKRSVRLIKECPMDGYVETTVRVISTNTAPADAATTLPAYVTGAGAFGVAPGSIQTNIVAYGPAQANVESATVDGHKVPFAAHVHSDRPVGIVAQRLAPGETKTLDFTFGKIVQQTEPNLVVTPSVQPVNEVVFPTEVTSCDRAK